MTLPFRAFCSDERPGYPINLIPKHFGAIPFNHEGLLNPRLFRNIKYGEGSDVVTRTMLAYSIILQDVEKLLGLTLAKLENPYAFVTGIQLNSHRQQDVIRPGEMYEVLLRKRTDLFLT